MLLIHWAKHNLTSRILANGIHPRSGCGTFDSGVYAYPFSVSATANGTWRRHLKMCRGRGGNYNGFVFRLTLEDFPVVARPFYMLGIAPETWVAKTPGELSAILAGQWSAKPVECWDRYLTKDYRELEVILPRRIVPSRILRILRDRQPRKYDREKFAVTQD